jgi:hypothetical protein
MLIIIRSGKSINNVVILRRLFILLQDLIIMSITTVIYTFTRLDYNVYHDVIYTFTRLDYNQYPAVIYTFTILDYNEYHDIIIKSGKSINNRRDTHYNQVW